MTIKPAILIRESNLAKGLTVSGKVRKYKQHPELAKFKGKEYHVMFSRQLRAERAGRPNVVREPSRTHDTQQPET